MSRGDFLLDYLFPPTSLLLLLVLGLLFRRRQALSRALVLVAVALLLLSSLPIFAEGLHRPLAAGAPRYEAARHGPVAAILVPTGGAFDDGTGTWWPTDSSIARLATARRLQATLDTRLIVSGGSPLAGQPPESETLAAAFDLKEQEATLEPRARNSAETATAVVALLAGTPDPLVLLVTSPSHAARMAGVLRNRGLRVVVPDHLPSGGVGLRAFLPSFSGLKSTRAALYEYAGILWYLASGELALADLWPPQS